MGWFNTIIDVANLSAGIAQVDQLVAMRKQGAASAMMQAILQEVRNQIFNYKQAAISILELEALSPKVAAGGLRLLEARLKQSGITADIFSELSDKEYVAETNKFLRDNSTRLLSQLSTEERNEIDKVVNAGLNLPRYNYYIDNELKYQMYKEAQKTAQSSDTLSSLSPNKMGCVMLIAVTVIFMVVVSIFRDAPGFGMFLAAVASVATVYWLRRKSKGVQEARKAIQHYDNKMDLVQMERLDNEMGGDLRKANRLRDEAQALVKTFFGEVPVLPS
jgi:hypothetical protein